MTTDLVPEQLGPVNNLHSVSYERGYQCSSSEEFLERVIIHGSGRKELMFRLQKFVKLAQRPLGILQVYRGIPRKILE